MKPKDLAEIGIIAGLYATITILFAPLAYGPLQFRVSEIMKPLALNGRKYIAGLTVGLLVANLYSPQAGPWELVFMPVMCWLGGELAYLLRCKPYLAVTVYSAVISASVALMLNVVVGAPFFATLLWVFVSEIILMSLGVSICERILRRTQATGTANP